MSSAAHRVPPEQSGEHTVPPASERPHPGFDEGEIEESPTRVHQLAVHEVRAIFAGTEDAPSAVDVSGLELDDIPTRAVPSEAPARAASLSDEGFAVSIEVLEARETGVRPSRASEPPADEEPSARPRTTTWVGRVARVVARVLRLR